MRQVDFVLGKMIMKTILVLIAFIQSGLLAPTVDNLLVSLPDGQVRGKAYVSQSHVTYYGFRGIPYAKPPVGELRFEVPQPAESWSGILEASADSKSCISSNHLETVELESEDCLYINVYTPSLQPKEKLPVLFWIYGGGFAAGNGSKALYGPDFLIEENVIIVSFNYRLGAFGFLSTGDSVIPGNTGLKDQVFALKWTKRNIEYFGGDPDKITIFGQSAGGASVGLLLLSKKAKGLFRGAILESGSALVDWSLNPNPMDYTSQLVTLLSGEACLNDTQKIRDFLKSKSVKEIMTSVKKLPFWVLLWPVIEVDNKDAFITEYHYELLKKGDFNQVPTMIGLCSEESIYFLKSKIEIQALAVIYDSSPKSLIPTNLKPNESDVDTLVQKIKHLYLDEGQSFLLNLSALIKYYNDNYFARGILKQAEIQSNFTPVYVYQFSYYGGRILSEPPIEGIGKAGHAAEVPYLFNISSVHFNDTNLNDIMVQKKMVKLWTNFAKYANPTPNKTNILNDVIWPTYDSINQQFLNINDSLQLDVKLKSDMLKIWTDIFETYGLKPLNTY